MSGSIVVSVATNGAGARGGNGGASGPAEGGAIFNDGTLSLTTSDRSTTVKPQWVTSYSPLM